jgi:hypothetical protein
LQSLPKILDQVSDLSEFRVSFTLSAILSYKFHPLKKDISKLKFKKPPLSEYTNNAYKCQLSTDANHTSVWAYQHQFEIGILQNFQQIVICLYQLKKKLCQNTLQYSTKMPRL